MRPRSPRRSSPLPARHGRRRPSRALALLAIGAALAVATPAHAFLPDRPPMPTMPKPAASTIDVVLIRPLGAVQTAVGAVLLVPTALITLPTGRAGIEEAYEMMVKRPAEDTFVRPLGEF